MWIRQLLFVSVMVALFGPPLFAAPLLREQRWQDHAHGLSLRPPIDTKLVEGGAKEHVLRMDGPGYTMTLKFNRSAKELDIEDVFDAAIRQTAFIDPRAVILGQQLLNVADRAAALVYLKMKGRESNPWFAAHGFVQIDPLTTGILTMETVLEQADEMKALFEGVLNSIELLDPVELHRERSELVQSGVDWRRGLSGDHLLAVLVPVRWMRICQDDGESGTDVGYMVIRERSDERMDLEGIRVDVQSRINVADRAFDSLSNFFLSTEGTKEFWSIKTTVRPIGPKILGRSRSPVVSWAETGVRDLAQITISVEGPSGHQTHRWQLPPRGYLSQVELYLMGRLLPRRKAQTLGFYAYHSSLHELTFRSERVQPGPADAFRVHSRPSLEQAEQVSQYSRNGTLIRRILPGGRFMIPATAEELVKIWKGQLRDEG